MAVTPHACRCGYPPGGHDRPAQCIDYLRGVVQIQAANASDLEARVSRLEAGGRRPGVGTVGAF